MAYGTLAFDLILDGKSGRLVCLRKGVYSNVPLEEVTATKKFIDVDKYYHTERLRPKYKRFDGLSPFIGTGDV